MHESVIRLLGCARLVTRNAGSRKVTDLKEVGAQLLISSATMTNWKKRGISKEGALKAEEVFGCRAAFVLEGVGNPFDFRSPPGFDEDPIGVLANPDLWDADMRGVSNPVDVQRVETSLPLSWEQLMSADRKGTLPESFTACAPDNACAPLARAGNRVLFRKNLPVFPGVGVLVRDCTGALYLRQYTETRGPGLWEAQAKKEHFRSFKSDEDGLTIVAVVEGVIRGWEEEA